MSEVLEDTYVEEDNQVLDILNAKDQSYYVGLFQRYMMGMELSEEELQELKQSNLLNSISENIDKLKDKKATQTELQQLQMAELTLMDLQRKIGKLEIEKSFALEQVRVLEEKKADYLREMGISHSIPRNTNWVVDLDTGDILIKDK